MYMNPNRILKTMAGTVLAITLTAGAQTTPAPAPAPAAAPAPLSTFVLTGPLQDVYKRQELHALDGQRAMAQAHDDGLILRAVAAFRLSLIHI